MTKKETKNKKNKKEEIVENIESEIQQDLNHVYFKQDEMVKLSDVKNTFTPELDQKFSDIGIKVRDYISIAEKSVLVDGVLDDCLFYDDNGLLNVDYIQKMINFNLCVMFAYSNIEMDSDENFVGDYDYLESNGFFDYIDSCIGSEDIFIVEDLLEDKLAQKVKNNNSLEGVVARGIDKLVEKMPDQKSLKKILNDIPKMINKINPENLNMVKEVFTNMNIGNVSGVSNVGEDKKSMKMTKGMKKGMN